MWWLKRNLLVDPTGSASVSGFALRANRQDKYRIDGEDIAVERDIAVMIAPDDQLAHSPIDQPPDHRVRCQHINRVNDVVNSIMGIRCVMCTQMRKDTVEIVIDTRRKFNAGHSASRLPRCRSR